MIKRTLVYTLLLFGSIAAAAQEIPYDSLSVIDYTRSKKYEIADVQVSGVKFIQKEVLVSLSGLKVGNTITVPGDDITNVLKKFWDQGLFSDVKITASKIEGNKIWIDIFLQERPRMSRINFEGISKSEQEDIMEKINLRNGQQVTDNIMDDTRRIIKDHFVEKGFLNTVVDVVPKEDTVNINMVVLNVAVHKNERIKIDEIYLSGNNTFSDSRLRRVMKKSKKVNMNIFKASKVLEDGIEEDKRSLVDFYNKNGYRDAKVLSDSLSPIIDKRVNLYVRIEEGDKYYFGDIKWIGNTKYPSEILSTVLGIKKGDVFDQEVLDNRLLIDEDAVNSIYLDNGYLFFSLDPVEVSVEDDTIDFEMRIYEGKQATINNIIIKGNSKTNEHVVRREIRSKPGDLFSKQDIIRTVRELASLGHFDPEQIEPNPIPNVANGTVDIEYSLVEKANDQLEVSGGYGGGMLVGTVGIRFSNFSARRLFDSQAWRPVPSGDGQTLSLRGQTNGQYYRSLSFSFVEPWFGGKKPNSLTLSIYHSRINSYNSLYSYYLTQDDVPDEYMLNTGATVGLGRRLTWPDDFFTLYNTITYQRYFLKDYSNYFITDNGAFNIFSFNTTIGRNSTDQPIYPRRGSNFSLEIQLTPPYSLLNNKDYSDLSTEEKFKWVEYHRWWFKADWYTRIVGDLVLYTRLHFGYLGYYNKEIGPAPFQSFDVGGDGLATYQYFGRETIALRGYENGSLTPVHYTSEGTSYKAGNVYTKFTAEIRYPVTMNPSATIYVLGFLEGGNAYYSIEEFNPFEAKRAAGFGVRAYLPMFGLLGIDWGYGFDMDNAAGSDGISGSQFHFTIGQQF